MTNILPHDAFVVVCDARKALFLSNTGTALAPKLAVTETLQAPDNPRTADAGDDQPGRTVTPGGRKSAMEPTDIHDLGEARFARQVAGVIEQRMASRQHPLYIAAAPRFLATLRSAYGAKTRAGLRLELHKDLVKHPVAEITDAFLKA